MQLGCFDTYARFDRTRPRALAFFREETDVEFYVGAFSLTISWGAMQAAPRTRRSGRAWMGRPGRAS